MGRMHFGGWIVTTSNIQYGCRYCEWMSNGHDHRWISNLESRIHEWRIHRKF